MNEIVPHVERPKPAAQKKRVGRDHLTALLQAARDPSVDVGKTERLMTLYKDVIASEARKTFTVAKIEMRPAMPKVEKRGEIIIHEKGTQKVIQSTPFARFEDIHDAVFPVLIKHGFDLDFRTTCRDGRVVVTAVLTHIDGHSEETSLEGPLDTSGSKNNIQGVGSTLSYLKRYTMCAILNIRTADKGEFDDDGRSSGMVDGQIEVISDEQVRELRNLLEQTGLEEAKFIDWLGYPLEQMPPNEFETRSKQLRFRLKNLKNEGNHG